MCSIPLPIRFNKIDVFIEIYDGIRCLLLLDHSWFDKICNSINILYVQKWYYK